MFLFMPCTAAQAISTRLDPLRRSVESDSGDPFGLSKRAQPPFILTKDLRSFQAIKMRMKEPRS
jgi:hypothetical protein